MKNQKTLTELVVGQINVREICPVLHDRGADSAIQSIVGQVQDLNTEQILPRGRDAVCEIVVLRHEDAQSIRTHCRQRARNVVVVQI